ncbi:hypothetical protein Mpe_A3319 [Methylibium petroleiphilum PM1]|uniref:Uncharacterized protein n=1 Tax=Methylibium petroleiphilum (strain ATCC BAA-1232 / LMG 22953 / PM1) TaxID=420662 RepID=A2SL33_METPP|nr:hypothetical protein Mpe_A3319 [Methylibium petroleiphilum PM1]
MEERCRRGAVADQPAGHHRMLRLVQRGGDAHAVQRALQHLGIEPCGGEQQFADLVVAVAAGGEAVFEDGHGGAAFGVRPCPCGGRRP